MSAAQRLHLVYCSTWLNIGTSWASWLSVLNCINADNALMNTRNHPVCCEDNVHEMPMKTWHVMIHTWHGRWHPSQTVHHGRQHSAEPVTLFQTKLPLSASQRHSISDNQRQQVSKNTFQTCRDLDLDLGSGHAAHHCASLNNNNKRICIAQVCRMTSEALGGQLQSCYTVRARPKCLTEEKCFQITPEQN